ncbi:unnamed protein product [Anisakis simplex]|uniref:RAB3GAP2_N domain-containing protein n=1 Tax=Anisakis simplex TaxID=6269 RepID=A0A0M3J5I0_ANISI|nr:unnamed protein product [Anisakis simplex]
MYTTNYSLYDSIRVPRTFLHHETVRTIQVCRPWDGAVDSGRLYALRPCVRVSSLGVFVCLSRRIYWACDKSPLSGHRLRRIVPMKLVINDTFETLSAGCVGAKNIDALTVCRNNEVFIYRLKNRNFCSLPAFPSCYGSTMVQLIALNTSVYVLDSSGCIYMKRNLGDVTPFGSEWFVLNTGDCGSPIVSFAVTNVSIWVLTAEASVFMMSTEDGKNVDETSLGSSRKPEWIQVKTPLGGDVSFDQIRASCSGMYVWLFSSVAGRLWARNSVSKQSPTGKSWSEVSVEENCLW